ncbi:MAG: hypothetical protein NVS4B3_12120 [Gemmatimonadaceae bacterium]
MGSVRAQIREQAQMAREQAQLAREQTQMLRQTHGRDAAWQGGSGTMMVQPFGPSPETQRMILTGAMTLILAAAVVLFPVARALGRRLERGGKTPAMRDGGNAEQLQRIEQAVDTMAIEIERISEAQRFTVNLLADRTGTAARSLAP